MAISLYDLSVTGALQVLGAVTGILDRGLAHCVENNIDPNSLVEARLVDDMLPLHFQIVSVVHHSLGTINSLKAGVATPPPPVGPLDYAGLQKHVADALSALKALTAEEINGLEGKDVTFEMGSFKLPFLAEGYVMSFSVPNLHFHATTTYDILRARGVPLGKRDYLGQMRMKG
jgi:uncharacterized protein